MFLRKKHIPIKGQLSQGKNLSREGKLPIPVDLIRTVAILGVILLHASNDLTNQPMGMMSQTALAIEIFRWVTVDIYQSIGRVGVPIFVMLSGALLLQPSKKESLSEFFKKRWVRIGIPFVFWAAIYFVWDFAVQHQAFTAGAVIQGVLTGPYFQFWYIYMLVGLYLLTPFLRVMVAHSDPSLFKFFIVMWFTGSAVLPVLALISPYHLDGNVLTIPGYVGYYILGVYLLNVKVRRSTLALLMSLGFALTVFGTYIMAGSIGGPETYFFQQYLSPTLILSAVMLFLLLSTVKKPSIGALTGKLTTESESPQKETVKEKVGHPKVGKLLSVISVNTLPIFLFHEMVLESLQKGYLGVTINGNTINSIIGVPLISAITLGICLLVILPLKRVPVLKKLLG